ncbi:hypothetical protein [Streptomyces sp. TLI_185]|uniref:hypothetical protein n=1 Tax=Streptomyces sp. TLI_185 TaxID=2485151 RepID=UPI00288B414E|nr:hypothetical protein [Streptomyces sp. TLI_185]
MAGRARAPEPHIDAAPRPFGARPNSGQPRPSERGADWAAQAAPLLATPEAGEPELAARATVLMGAGLPVADHFVVRAFETWIHSDDIGRALGLAVPPPRHPLGTCASWYGCWARRESRSALNSPWIRSTSATWAAARTPPTRLRAVPPETRARSNVLERAASLSWL